MHPAVVLAVLHVAEKAHALIWIPWPEHSQRTTSLSSNAPRQTGKGSPSGRRRGIVGYHYQDALPLPRSRHEASTQRMSVWKTHLAPDQRRHRAGHAVGGLSRNGQRSPWIAVVFVEGLIMHFYLGIAGLGLNLIGALILGLADAWFSRAVLVY